MLCDYESSVVFMQGMISARMIFLCVFWCRYVECACQNKCDNQICCYDFWLLMLNDTSKGLGERKILGTYFPPKLRIMSYLGSEKKCVFLVLLTTLV